MTKIDQVNKQELETHVELDTEGIVTGKNSHLSGASVLEVVAKGVKFF